MSGKSLVQGCQIVGRIYPIAIIQFSWYISPHCWQWISNINIYYTGAQFAGWQFAWGPIFRGPICQGPIYQGNGKLGPQKWGAQFARFGKKGPICLEIKLIQLQFSQKDNSAEQNWRKTRGKHNFWKMYVNWRSGNRDQTKGRHLHQLQSWSPGLQFWLHQLVLGW